MKVSFETRSSTFSITAVPRADHALHKSKERAAEDTSGSGSEEDFSDSEDEGTDGYKKGENQSYDENISVLIVCCKVCFILVRENLCNDVLHTSSSFILPRIGSQDGFLTTSQVDIIL